MNELNLNCESFSEGGWIPLKHTGRGEDLSPCIQLSGIDPKAKSIAITLDDASHPIFSNYNHWVIWNIPVMEVIPEAIPHGKIVDNLGGAIQGIAYGRHRYKGPKPPLKSIHTYVFTVYVLDCRCELAPESRKRDLLTHSEGHVLQMAILSGKFQSHT